MRTRTLNVMLALATLVCLAPTAGATGMSANMQMAPGRSVRGVPFEITLTVTNSSKHPYAWPTHVVARVVDASGAARLVRSQGHWSSEIPPFVVPSGATVSVVLDAPSVLDGNRFLPSSASLPPGRYRLELSFGKQPFRLTAPPIDGGIDPLEAEVQVTAAFEILEPQGEDAIVYNRLRSALNGDVALSAVGPQDGRLHDWVWQKHPTSSYAPFLRRLELPGGPTLMQMYERVMGMLENRPAIRDEIRLEFVEMLSRHAGNTYHDKGVTAALKVADQLDQVVKELEASPFASTRSRLDQMRPGLVDRRSLLAPDNEERREKP